MRISLLSIAFALLSCSAWAETTLIDTSALPSVQAHDVATATPLALTAEGAPAVVLLDLDAGDVVPPHATKTGLRLLTVLSGELSWGDGSVIDESQEAVYPAGSILTIPPKLDHWLAARKGEVRLQLVLLDDETPAPGVRDQMQ